MPATRTGKTPFNRTSVCVDNSAPPTSHRLKMLNTVEYQLVLEIETARSHAEVLRALAASQRLACGSDEFRKRVLRALHWARIRVRSMDNHAILTSRATIAHSRQLLRRLAAG